MSVWCGEEEEMGGGWSLVAIYRGMEAYTEDTGLYAFICLQVFGL